MSGFARPRGSPGTGTGSSMPRRRASICSADTVAYDLRCPPGRPLGLAVGNDTARPCRANTSAGDGATTDWPVDAEDDDDDNDDDDEKENDDADHEPDEAEGCASRNFTEPL